MQACSREVHAPSANVAISLWTEAHFFCGLRGDVSNGGVFISTSFPLVVGSAVQLDFSRRDSEISLHACGEVRWMREFSALGPRGIGIAWEGLSADDRRRIDEFCMPPAALRYAKVG